MAAVNHAGKRGRPPIADRSVVRALRLVIRFTEAEHRAIVTEAARAGNTMADTVRAMVRASVGLEDTPPSGVVLVPILDARRREPTP